MDGLPEKGGLADEYASGKEYVFILCIAWLLLQFLYIFLY